MAIPLIPLILAGLGGGVIGALSRQPEINRLKKQVQLLQEEIQRLQSVIEEQNRQIQELSIRYKTLKAWQFSERARSRAQARGAIMHQWAFKEYIELLCFQSRELPISEDEKKFFNAYENLLSGKGDMNERVLIRDYVAAKYSYQVSNLIPVADHEITKMVEETKIA